MVRTALALATCASPRWAMYLWQADAMLRRLSMNRAELIAAERAKLLAQVLAIVEPFALNQWGGGDVLRKLRALGNNSGGNKP